MWEEGSDANGYESGSDDELTELISRASSISVASPKGDNRIRSTVPINTPKDPALQKRQSTNQQLYGSIMPSRITTGIFKKDEGKRSTQRSTQSDERETQLTAASLLKMLGKDRNDNKVRIKNGDYKAQDSYVKGTTSQENSTPNTPSATPDGKKRTANQDHSPLSSQNDNDYSRRDNKRHDSSSLPRDLLDGATIVDDGPRKLNFFS